MRAPLQIPLPDFLTADQFGFVRIAGSRISLVDVVHLYSTGSSAESIAEKFPTISLAAIHRVIAFYIDNQAAIDAYVRSEIGDAEMRRAEHVPSEKMRELRDRVKSQRAARLRAAHAS